MPNPSPTAKVIAAVRNAPGNRVKVAVSDIDGVLRGKYIHKDKFYSAVEGGFGFCDVVFGWDMMDVTYDNTTLTGWHKGFPDVLAKIDLGTFRTVPWDGGVPFFLGDFVADKDGKEVPLPICPRQVLKRVLKRAEALGVVPMCGMEFEWFNFAETPASWAEKKGVGPDDDHARNVRLFAVARERQPRLLLRADERDGRVRRSDRRLAHRDRARRVRGGDPVLGGARSRRSGGPVQDRREGDRRALRHHAELHGEVEPAPARLLGAHSSVALRREEEPVLRCEEREPHEQALRELPRRPGRRAHGDRADVLADDQQLQAARRRLLGAGEAHVGSRQPDGELPRDRRLAEGDAPRDPLSGRRHEPLSRRGRGARRGSQRRRAQHEAHDASRSTAPTRERRTSRAPRAR